MQSKWLVPQDTCPRGGSTSEKEPRVPEFDLRALARCRSASQVNLSVNGVMANSPPATTF